MSGDAMFKKMFLGEHAVEGDEARRRIVLTPEQQASYVRHVNGTCEGCQDCEPDWNGPTKADVQAQLKREQKATTEAQRKERLAKWRAENPRATCNDAVAMMLAELEDTCRPRKSA